ncbi:short chain dehydrogenase reductase [Annulohypoxylon maeteangense]|uniref:short chain dehydrogenase reductase n=1 Tax=Annulohypoxylon maeteangense TaxID=1927788 RepID=UPI00200871FE|nr:short chain dehydrogenase reductase [Annulohypoxylon maeteangense]KAI0889181.1 short chain dehydrogenase reductase [Annulohypoxylon maeteangense]
MTDLSITNDMIPDLSGKTAIVTGGSSGIGRGAVEILLEHKAQVFILDVQPPPQDLESTSNPIFIKTDISSWPSLVDAFSTITCVHRASVDIAIANAGVSENGNYLQQCFSPAPLESAGWLALKNEGGPDYSTIAVNLEGTMNFVMLAARVMKGQADGGSIVITTSATAYVPEYSLPVYCAAKAALTNLIRTLRTTLPLHNIAISGVAPSATESSTIPPNLVAPILASGLPVSTARHAGLAIVYSATAKQSRRVEDYGKDSEDTDSGGRWNGRVIHTISDTFTEVEDMLIQTRPQWWGKRNVELVRKQQTTTDTRDTMKD